MEVQKGSINDRLGASRKERKEHHREQRLSKAIIGGPIQLKEKSSESHDTNDVTGGPSLVMKCVIVQRDERGYGLTVSGDNPVYVQSVKEDGAAHKAGVVQGDRIIKVNGSKVTECNHVEVVKLIKADSYVALTLLGAPVTHNNNLASGDSPIHTEVQAKPKQSTGKTTFYDEKVETIKKMLLQETAEVERIKEEYAKNPIHKLLLDLGTAQKLKQDLEKQLWKVESLRNKSPEPTEAGNPLVTDVDDNTGTVTEETLIDMSDDVSEEKGSIREQRSATLNDDITMELISEDSNNPFVNNATPDTSKPATPQPQNKAIMNFEDDDMAESCDTSRDHGPFTSYEQLRLRPSYMSVFLSYVIGSHDPANLLLALSVESYKTLSNTKEMVKVAETIFRTYLSQNAPLKVEVDEGIVRSIYTVAQSKNPTEETLRGVFDPAVKLASKEVQTQLTQYCVKREQGLGNLFGDEKLPPCGSMETQQEARIVDEIIGPLITELPHDISNTGNDMEQTRLSLILEALQSFLLQYGTKRKTKITSRMYSMLRPKPQPALTKGKMSGSMESIIDDNKRSSGIMNFIKPRRNTRNDPSAIERARAHHEKKEREASKKKPRESVLWENSEILKPTKVTTEKSEAHDGSLMINIPKRVSSHSPIRSRSVPTDDANHTNQHQRSSVIPVIQTSPQDPNLADALEQQGKVSLLVKQFQDGESDTSDNDGLNVDNNARYNRSERRGSFRRHREDEKRHTGGTKSHSDPDRTKVEQAVVQHNASETPETKGNHPTDPTLDLLQNIPSFADDPEMNLDAVEQQWSKSVSSDVLRSIDRKETKRQEVINELIFTEQHHLRDLKILEKLFYEPMKTHNLLNDDELYQAFPNLSEVVRLHRELNRSLQEVKTKEGSVVGDLGGLLLKRFDGDAGNTFKEESAHYCGNQSTVLAFVKERAKKDQKFANFIQGAQRHPICRKLHLKDFVPMEFQRLTKYPLLLENIIKNTKKKQETELNNLKRACERCREILAFVNQTVKVAEDKQQILEINNNLDRSSFVKNTNPVIQEYKNIDLTQHPVVHHGPLTLRVGQMDKRKEIFVHCILYEELLVLLQKQDDRFVLKSLSAGQDKTYSPFLKMGKLIIRNVATDKRAFFVMSLDKEAFMYEFATSSTSVVKQWMAVLSDTSARWKETPNKVSHRREAFLVPGTSKDIPDYDGIKEAGELIGRREENLPQVPILELSVMPEDDNDEQQPVVADDNDLIASRAPPTLYEQIKIKQREISEAFATKRRLLAMYAGAGEGDFEGVMEMLHLDGNPQPQALVMDALLHVDKLTSLLNETSSPENSFTRSQTTPGHETGYQSDNPPDPQERWATPVTPNPPSPMMSSSATLNSISDIPQDIGQSEASVKPDEPLCSPMHDDPDVETIDLTPLGGSPNLPQPSYPDTSVFETPNNKTQGYEVMSQSSIVPITKMMDIIVNLQTQLTHLLHITSENEIERQKLKQENEFFKEQLEKKDDAPDPPTYADVLQGL